MINKYPKVELFKTPDDSSVLYRYVTIDKLLDFLLWERIPFIRLNIFDDKLEGVNGNHLLLNYTTEMLSQSTPSWFAGVFKQVILNINPSKRISLSKERELFQKTNFASCWYINEHESAAMWHLYSKPDSVAIRVPYKSIFNEIMNHHFETSIETAVNLRMGCIEYCRYNDLQSLEEIVFNRDMVGFIKDSSFQYENEFRIILKMIDRQADSRNKFIDTNIIYFKLMNFKSMPFEIIFHPKADDWHKMNIIKIINKFELPFKTSESVLKEIFKL